MSKNTLILGHSHYMDKNYDIRCSPIDVKEWINDPFVCVDFYSDDCDIEYNLYLSQESGILGIKYKGYWNWVFAEDSSYDRIIDTMGSINWVNPRIPRYRHESDLLKTIKRVLKPSGKFYSYTGIYTLTKNDDLILEEKELDGYQYKYLNQ